MKAQRLSRTRLLGASTVLLIAALLCVPSARAQACGHQSDFLVRVDPLMAPVRPADCATVFSAAPDFTWPAQGAAAGYIVTLTFPDGHNETRATSTNWLAWDREIPPGRYEWKVSVPGRSPESGAARTFTLTN